MHAVLMGTWLTLLLAQSTFDRDSPARCTAARDGLTRAGPCDCPHRHRTDSDDARRALDGLPYCSPEFAAQLAARLKFSANILLFQIRAGVVFGALVWLALRARSTDAGLHKRLMILATLVLMPAALDRMSWLPSTLPQSPLTMEIYPLVLLLPMFLWDLYRQRQVHRAYLIYALINAPLVILTIPALERTLVAKDRARADGLRLISGGRPRSRPCENAGTNRLMARTDDEA